MIKKLIMVMIMASLYTPIFAGSPIRSSPDSTLPAKGVTDIPISSDTTLQKEGTNIPAQIAQATKLAKGIRPLVPVDKQKDFDLVMTVADQAYGVATEVQDFADNKIKIIKEESASLKQALFCVNHPTDPMCMANFACDDKISCSMAALIKATQLLVPLIGLIATQSNEAKLRAEKEKIISYDQGAFLRAVKLEIVPPALSNDLAAKAVALVQKFNDIKGLVNLAVATLAKDVALKLIADLSSTERKALENITPVTIPQDETKDLEINNALEGLE